MTENDLDAVAQAALRALEMVIDPEVGLDIVTMGLVYELEIRGDVARVTYTLTSRGCPLEAVITQGIRDAMGFVRGINAVETNLVWEPAWHSGMITQPSWDG